MFEQLQEKAAKINKRLDVLLSKKRVTPEDLAEVAAMRAEIRAISAGLAALRPIVRAQKQEEVREANKWLGSR
jgi:hypothetical protein